MPRSLQQLRSRRGTASLLALGALGALGLGAGRLPSPAAAFASLMPPGDTVVIWGPRQFNGSSGQGQTYVERFTATVTPGRLHTLRLVNGNPSGGQRASKVTVRLNGFEVVKQTEVTQAVGLLERVIALTPVDTIRVTVAGSGNPFITLSILDTPDPNYDVFGPTAFATPQSGIRDTTVRFHPGYQGIGTIPGRLYVVNGAADGTLRVTGVTITVNGQSFSIGSAIGSLTSAVTLTRQPICLDPPCPLVNTLRVNVTGSQGRFVTVRVTVRDSTAPVLTITSPAPGSAVNLLSIPVTGTVQDRTATTVTVNGVAAAINDTVYSATVPLASEGSNLLTVTAIDAAGLRTDSTRTVIRDTGAPVLTVSQPAEGAQTTDPSIVVSGSVTDATAVTVNVNGTALPVEPGGGFSGAVPLTEGANILTITATDAAQNATTVVRNVLRDNTPAALTVTEPAEGTVIAAADIAVSGTATDASAVTVRINGTQVPVAGNGSFNGTAALVEGPNTIVVVATDALENTTTVNRSVTRTSGTSLPPDPATVAPPIDRTVATSVLDATSFIYTGPNPIQTGVATGTIAVVRAGLVRGRVMDRAGQPLPGATVSVHGHPELGQTLSRADGRFDLVVNGGTTLTLSYAKAGYLPVQRQVLISWQDYVVAPDVALIPRDPVVTVIDFSDSVEVARGSVMSDGDGSRRGTLVFEQGTAAAAILPGGDSVSLPSVSVRVTEFTVGPTGPAAMPGTLPATSGYTYAAELGVDEAAAAGASTVTFTKPVAFYVENFVGFPVGTKVPVASYDRAQGKWIPATDGRVIKILGVTAGRADLDVSGSGTAAAVAALDSLGITPAERGQLATLYPVGQALWRTEHTHFTPYDWNWPYGPPPDAIAPLLADFFRERPPCPGQAGGSIISCEDQALGESIDVAGTPFSLNYWSSRIEGRSAERSRLLSLSGPGALPGSLKRIELEIEVAGREHRQTFQPLSSQRFEFTWDGRDAYGRQLQGAQPFHARVGYVYDVRFGAAAQATPSFGVPSGVPQSNDLTRGEITLWQDHGGTIGVMDAFAQGIGSWTLDVHHAYDPIAKVLHTGDGRQRGTDPLSGVLRTAAGGRPGSGGDGGLATDAGLGEPIDVAVAADGSLYIADVFNHKIRKVNPAGIITTVAGTGVPGAPSGDGGQATQAQLVYPSGVAAAPDGSLYIVDGAQSLIRKVAPDGIISTIAGGGTVFPGDGLPATQAEVYPTRVAVGPDGIVYFDDINRVRRVGPDGILTTLAGTGTRGSSGDGGPAIQAEVDPFFALTVGPDGSVFFINFDNQAIRRIAPNGIISRVAGGGPGGPMDGDGGPATGAEFGCLTGVAAGADGGLFISDQCSLRLRRVGPEGRITTVAGSGGFGSTGDGGPAAAGTFENTMAVAVAPDGRLYVADDAPNRIREIRPAMPGASAANLSIASEDGREVYEFSGSGRHLRTLDALTGAVLLAFGYDGAGRLATVTDPDDNVTTIQRDVTGRPFAIDGPFGQRTTVSLDLAGYLSRVTNPAGEEFRPEHDADGRLDRLTDPRGKVYQFAYDSVGRLRRDEDPAGGFQTLSRAETDSGYTVTRTTALGRSTAYLYERLSTGARRQAMTDPRGLTTSTILAPNDSSRSLLPDGTLVNSTRGGDPRWGMQSPVGRLTTVRLPSGLTATVREGRRAATSSAGNPFSLTAWADTVTLNGNATVTAYDPAARRFTTTTPEGRQSTVRADEVGRVLSSRTAGFDSLRYSYDPRGRLEQMATGGRVWTYGYDQRGRLQSTTDPLARRDSLFYDDADRLTRQVRPDGRQILFAYDSSGNLTGITPPARPLHRFDYTAVGLDSVYGPPSLGSGTWATTYQYNLDRQVTRIGRPDGGEIGFGYDAAGRPGTVTFDRGTLTLNYSPTTGSVTGIAAPGGNTLAFGYDGALPRTVTWGGPVAGSVAVTYNTDFRVATQTVNGANSLAFAYDRDGLLKTAGALGVKRQATHGLPERDSVGVVKSAWSFDTRGALSGYTATAGASTLYQTSYVRDSLLRISELTETVQGTTTVLGFSYDSVGRLVEVRRGGVVEATYEYDANGNRERLTTPGGVVTGSSDAQDRLTAYGQATYGYTPAGELAYRAVGSDTTDYSYDYLGNLVAVTLPDGTAITYVIDGQNRRVGKRVNGVLVQGFLYENQLKPVVELNGSNQVVSRFVYGTKASVPDYMVKGGVTYRLVSDHLGSVRVVVNTADGAVAQRVDYDEFGRVTANSNPGFQPFGFAGGLADEQTGLVRFGARDYDPAVGRWTIKDPAGFSGGANLYAYAHSDPVNLVDPDGNNPGLVALLVAAAELGLSAVDLLDFLRTLGHPCVGALEKLISGGLFAAGLIGPGGGYGRLDDAERYADYWKKLQGRAPERSSPFDVRPKYDADGNVRGATTYDQFGNRAYQYEFGSRTRHGEGYHQYDNSGPHTGSGKGPRSGHIPY